jgi:hypothetical protein
LALASTGSPAEREATLAATRVTRGRAAPEISQSVPAATIQRQPDDTDATPAQAPMPDWTPTQRGIFSIAVESSKAVPDTCDGYAGSGMGAGLFSACGRIEHFCTTPARYPLTIRCYTDSVNIPRPQPFSGPEIRVALDYVPEGSTSPTYSRANVDANPRYQGPGWWLVPSFGTDFTIASNQSGMLRAQVDLTDAGSGVRVSYVDTIRCRLVPCA